MTFDEIVDEVAEQLNLTSAEAIARIGRRVNRRYRRVTGDCGILTSGRFEPEVSETVTPGNRYVTFSDVEKLITVFTEDTPPRHLDELTFVEMRQKTVRVSDQPNYYAIVTSTATDITIMLDAEPETAYDLLADAIVSAAVLSGTDEPAFPASYHDVLIMGATADELGKSEKYEEAAKKETQFRDRMNELKLHLRTSASLQIQQNKFGGLPRFLRRR